MSTFGLPDAVPSSLAIQFADPAVASSAQFWGPHLYAFSTPTAPIVLALTSVTGTIGSGTVLADDGTGTIHGTGSVVIGASAISATGTRGAIVVGTSHVGTITAEVASDNVEAALSGQESTSAIGSVVVSTDVVMTGEAAAGSIGTGAVGLDLVPTGADATGSSGAVTSATSVGSTGVGSVGDTGTFGEADAASVEGVEAASVAGASVAALEVVLAGETATGDVGSLDVDTAAHAALSGEVAAGEVGAVLSDDAVPALGVEGVAALGAAVVTGDVTGTADVTIGAPAIAGVGLGGPILSTGTTGPLLPPRRRRVARKPQPITGTATIVLAGPTITGQGVRVPPAVRGTAALVARAGALDGRAELQHRAVGALDGTGATVEAIGKVYAVTRPGVAGVARRIEGSAVVELRSPTLQAAVSVRDVVDVAWQTLQRDHDDGADEEALVALGVFEP